MPARLILETPRLLLREMREDDLTALCAMLCDPEVMYAYAHAFSEDEARQWLDRQLQRCRRDGFGLWAVTLKQKDGSSGAMIGQCGLTWQECPPVTPGRVLEVGYLLRKSRWRQGYATEAARACRDYAFTMLGAGEVFSIIRASNTPSRAVALRNGMTVRAGFNKRYHGLDMPHLVFSITRSRWRRQQAAGGMQRATFAAL